MIALLKKELRSFLSSLIGYVVIGVFLLLVGLFMWVFPGELNVIDYGFATLDTLFYVAPWVFMFLIPAITMRLFAEEKRTGTIELLLTKPISDIQIILAKYLAGLILVVIALLPTLIYFASVFQLGNPAGNMDTGGTWGSYLGLLFLGSSYVAIGIFASSITSNQIVSFLVAAMLCFFMFFGFEGIGSFDLFGQFDHMVISMGLSHHYVNMSRGLIDTRDIVYFAIVTALFLFITRLAIQSRKW